MKTKTLGLIHTSATLVPVFGQLCSQKLPGVHVFNIADDSLVKGIMAAGKLTSIISRRVASYLESAELAGADYIMVTCSSIGPAVEAGALLAGVPVLRVDQPMADRAVMLGDKVGVVATLRTTLDPTADLIQRRAAMKGRTVKLEARLVEGAFEALMGGQAARHDELVAAALKDLSAQVDVVVLAQASMARVLESIPEHERKAPVLSSPGLAVDYLATVL